MLFPFCLFSVSHFSPHPFDWVCSPPPPHPAFALSSVMVFLSLLSVSNSILLFQLLRSSIHPCYSVPNSAAALLPSWAFSSFMYVCAYSIPSHDCHGELWQQCTCACTHAVQQGRTSPGKAVLVVWRCREAAEERLWTQLGLRAIGIFVDGEGSLEKKSGKAGVGQVCFSPLASQSPPPNPLHPVAGHMSTCLSYVQCLLWPCSHPCMVFGTCINSQRVMHTQENYIIDSALLARSSWQHTWDSHSRS